MSAPVTPSPPVPLDRLEEPETIDDVLRNIDQIIDWSIRTESHIGYFAALYRRITLGIRDAVSDGLFDDGKRMEQLDIAFARRYFDALNAYFYTTEYQGPPLPWEVAFVGDQDDQAIIVQHVMAALNAHISFDLGLAVLEVAANSLNALADDYNRVNGVICSQVPGVVRVVQQLSPDFRRTPWLTPDEVAVLQVAMRRLRRGAWLFAIYMAMHPQNTRQKTVNQEAWTATLGSWYLQPSGWWSPFPILVRAIAKHESDNVAANIEALEEISNRPDKLNEAYL